MSGTKKADVSKLLQYIGCKLQAKNILNGPVAADVAGRLVFLSLTDAYARRDDGATFPVVKRLILFRSMVTGRLD